MTGRPIALLVCGSRTWTDYGAIVGALGVSVYPRGTLLVHGGAAGADRLAARWWQERGGADEVVCVPYFGHLGKRGGYARNTVLAALLSQMAIHGGFEPRVEAFDMGTPGTNMMCGMAERYEFPVRRHTP